jgi:hypothetical protein
MQFGNAAASRGPWPEAGKGLPMKRFFQLLGH